jgi:hypothetical protein
MTPAIIELLKLSVSVYFAIAQANNATEEELDAIYKEQKKQFLENSPDKLPDV